MRTRLVVGAVAAMLLVGLVGTDVFAQADVRGFPNYGVVAISRPWISPQNAAMYRQLDEAVVSFTFNEQPLEEAFRFLGTVGNVNIVLDRRKIDAGKTVTLKLRNVSLTTALRFITQQVDLKWTVRDGVVYVSDEEGVKQEPVTVVHDVRDMLHPAPDFEGPEMDLGSIGNSNSETETETPWPREIDNKEKAEEKTPEELMIELVEVIRATIEPNGWDPAD